MCYTCGCKMPYEDHGDPHNLGELIQLEREAGELSQPEEKYGEG